MNHYHFDQLGSTRLLTNSGGAVTDEYSYDAYGAVLSHDRRTGSIDQPYQYVGQYGYYTHFQGPEFGLLQLGVRYYNPTTSTFTQGDPVQQTEPGGYLPISVNLTGHFGFNLTDLSERKRRWNL